MLVTALSAKYIKPGPASAPVDVTTFTMVHPTKGSVRADARSAPELERLGYRRASATPPQGKPKKG